MMDIDSEHLGIPEQDYAVVCEMPASEFQKTCKDIAMFSDSLNITATKVHLIIHVRFCCGRLLKFRLVSSLLAKVILVSLSLPTHQTAAPIARMRYVRFLEDGFVMSLTSVTCLAIAFLYVLSISSIFLLQAITLEVTDPVNVNFSIKYMNQFTKATSLSSRVRISLCNDVPIVIEYPLTEDGKPGGQQHGHLRFYLAPKIDDEENMD